MPKILEKDVSNGEIEQPPQYYDEFPEDEIHTMQALAGFKRQNGTDYYLVKWEGYSDAERTWEPVCNILKPTPEICRQMEVLKEKYLEKTRKRKRVIRDGTGTAQAEGGSAGRGSGSRTRRENKSVGSHTSKRGTPNRREGLDSAASANRVEANDEERSGLAKSSHKRGADVASVTSTEERILKRRRQTATSSAEGELDAAAETSGAGAMAGKPISKSGSPLTAKAGSVRRERQTSEGNGSSISQGASKPSQPSLSDSERKDVEILSLVVHKSSLQSKGLNEFGNAGPSGLELVNNPNISVQLIIKQEEGNVKEIFSLDYVKSRYPMELLDFMLTQVQYYRASSRVNA